MHDNEISEKIIGAVPTGRESASNFRYGAFGICL